MKDGEGKTLPCSRLPTNKCRKHDRNRKLPISQWWLTQEKVGSGCYLAGGNLVRNKTLVYSWNIFPQNITINYKGKNSDFMDGETRQEKRKATYDNLGEDTCNMHSNS